MVKKVIESLSSNDTTGIVSELIHITDYFNNPVKYYNFFDLQGGTIWILASYILAYKRGLLCITKKSI